MTPAEEQGETVQVLGQLLHEARRVAKTLANRLHHYWGEDAMQGFYNQHPWLKEDQ